MTPTNSKSPEVVIVGAGPTGLMAAALLARCGVRARIFEKNSGTTVESRAFLLQAKTMELMLNLGLAEDFLNKAVVSTGAQIHVDGARVAELNFDDIGRADTPFPFLLMLPQSETEELLANDVRKHGLEIEFGHDVLNIVQHKDKIVTTVKNSSGEISQIESVYIIGADGSHSIVRKTLGLEFKGEPYPQGFFLADCKVDWDLDYEHLKVFIHDQDFAVYLPLRGQDVGRIICAQPIGDPGTAKSAEGNTAEPLTLEEVELAFKKATNLPLKLHQSGWLARYRIHHRGVNKYREGRAFVAGDAAHIHSPVGGQGMNTGLQDAANLAWKIALSLKYGEDTHMLDSYHDERWPVGQKVLEYTDGIFANVTSQIGWKNGLRNLLVPLVAGNVLKNSFVRERAFHFVSQLGIHYHDSKYLKDQISGKATNEWKNGLTPGHRAPNALVTRDIDVFRLAAGYSFHLLALSIKSLGRDEIDRINNELQTLPADIGLPLKTHLIAHSLIGRDPRIVRVEASQIFHAYGITHEQPQAFYLIRPDGYIAFRANSLNFPALRAYLKELSPSSVVGNDKSGHIRLANSGSE